MKYLNWYYLANFIVFIISIGVMSLSKISVSEQSVEQIIIIGCNFESSALTYYLKNKNKDLNITVIQQQECHSQQTFKFIEGSNFVTNLLNQINFKYQKLNDIEGFWNGQQLILQTDNIYSQVYKYGLSSYALKYALHQFQKKLNKGFNEYSFNTIEQILKAMKQNIKQTPLKYFLNELGLDRDYIKTVIYSYLYGNYIQQLGDINLFAIKLKLLQLFNLKYQIIGTQSDLMFRLFQDTYINQKQHIKQIKRDQYNFIILTTDKTTYNASKIIFNNKTSLQTTQNKDVYYISTGKGRINNKYYNRQKLANAIFSSQIIAKIQNLCLVRCKREHENVYIITSRKNIADKDLKMFKQFEIKKVVKRKIMKYSNQESYPLSDGNGVYYLNPVYLLTDNKQFTLRITQYLSRMIISNK